MPARFHTLSVVLPMWNEEENIRASVGAAVEVCEELVREGVIRAHEVIIVDDASSDTTGAIADAMARADPRVRVVHHDRNRKLGGAIKSGIAASQGDVILYTDADLPCDIAELRKALRFMRLYQADLVSAFRNSRTGEGALRAAYSFGYNLLIRFLFGIRVRDVNFAFKLLRRSVVERVELRSEGSFIDVELLAKAHHHGFRIVQFGVDYVPRLQGTSTLARPSVILHILREMLLLWPEVRRVPQLPAAARRSPNETPLLSSREATPK